MQKSLSLSDLERIYTLLTAREHPSIAPAVKFEVKPTRKFLFRARRARDGRITITVSFSPFSNPNWETHYRHSLEAARQILEGRTHAKEIRQEIH